MTITLFPDQLEVREKARESMRRNRCILIQAVTGFGKTVLAADMILRAVQRGRKAMFIVPRRQLLWQTSASFGKAGIEYGYITSGKKPTESIVQMATLASVCKRLDEFTPDVVFIDEGHYSFEQTLVVARHYLAAGAWVVYLTATPKRGMDAVVQDVIMGESVEWMIANKRLSAYRAYSPFAPDLSMIPKLADDYHQGQLADKMQHETKALVGNMVHHWNQLAHNKMTLAYGVSIAHAEMMAHEFRENSIPSAAISSRTPDDVLLETIKAFARREIKILTNCDMATFGFDLSAASGMDVNVEAMIDGAPTLSATKQAQKNGRVLRYKQEHSIFLDHVGNINNRDGTRNHGLPCDVKEWPIANEGEKEKQQRAIPVKQCPTCYANHKPAPHCPYCGHEYMIEGVVIRQKDGTLVEIHKSDLPVEKPRFTQSEETAIVALTMQYVKNKGLTYPHARNIAIKRLHGGKK